MEQVFESIMAEVKKSPILAYAMKVQGGQAPQVPQTPLTTVQPQVEVPQQTVQAVGTNTPTQTASPY